MDGGVILIGVEREENSLFPTYSAIGIDNPDKISTDIASQCASSFNMALRPIIKTETIDNKNIIKVEVSELPESDKPAYIKNKGLPKGAFRRIGSSDQQCTDDDLVALFNRRSNVYDNQPLNGASLEDIDPDMVAFYRNLRERVNSEAEELKYSDDDLLKALSAVVDNNGKSQPSLMGILLFGKKQSLRRLLPGHRLDYIRVPGKEWVENPDERFSTIDMRDSLLKLVQRAQDHIFEDLPKFFSLEEGNVQAKSESLPTRVLREAIVNAVMHASYRIQQPIQIIKYTNRIEIRNPGYSLKNEDQLGQPGSRLRNPSLAAVFHETNLAETKGSGIRTMRNLMENAGFAPPTFESDRENDVFTARLLLHHFLTEKDILWLTNIGASDFSDEQKKALIFVRELGAIDNQAYRQLNACDTLTSSIELRKLRNLKYLNKKGKGTTTYYVPGEIFKEYEIHKLEEQTHKLEAETHKLDSQTHKLEAETHKLRIIPSALSAKLDFSSVRIGKEKRKELILELCEVTYWSASEIAHLVKIKDPTYLTRQYLKPLLKAKKLFYKYPEMPNHPKQAYTSKIGG